MRYIRGFVWKNSQRKSTLDKGYNMLKSRLLYFIALLLLLMAMPGLWSCEENPNQVELIDRNANIVTDTLFATYDTTFSRDKTITTLAAERLLLGKAGGIKNRIILRFSQLPDSITFDKAWIQLTRRGVIGDFPGNFQATAYPIRETWLADTSQVWLPNPDDNIDFSNAMGALSVTVSDTVDTVAFNAFGIQRLNEWADTSNGIDNNGLVLNFDAANFVKEYQARSNVSANGPKLFIQYKDTSDSTITDTLQALFDAFLVEGDFQPVPGRLHTTTLKSPRISIIQFDVASLSKKYPQGVIPVSADLELTIDQANTFYSTTLRPDLSIYPLASPIDSSALRFDSRFLDNQGNLNTILGVSLSSLNSDSTSLRVLGGSERQELAGNFIQELLNDPEIFSGLYIEDRLPGSTLRLMTFYRFNDGNVSQRPRLIISSIKLPEERL